MPTSPLRSKKKSKQKSQQNLAAQLAQLETAQLVRHLAEEEPAYIFKHTLTQDVSYQSLLQKQRREIHRIVAQAYEAQYGHKCLDEYAGILAQHYAQAGDDEHALIFATRAGELAARTYANTEAIAYYSSALASAARINAPALVVQELFLKRGRAFELLSHFDEAARNYDEMQEMACQRGDRALELAALLARALLHAIPSSIRDAERARGLANHALDLANELGDRPAQAKVYWIMLVTNIYSGGNNEEAIAHGEHSLAIARELNLREQLAFTLHDLFVAYSYRGDMNKARDVRLEAAELWRALDNKPLLAECMTGIAVLHYLLGDYAQAVEVARESFQLGQQIGNLGTQGFSGMALALTHIQLGEYAQALRSLDDAMPIVDFGGLEGNGISLHGLRAWVYACMGDAERARELMREALNRRYVDLAYQRLYLNALWTRIELIAGNVTEAARIANGGEVVVNAEQFERMFPPVAHIVYLACSELALAQRDYARALVTLDELLGHLHRRSTRTDISLALWLKAIALAGLDRRDEASQVWTEALAEAEALHERGALWKILFSLSEHEARCGNPIEAETFRQRAHAVIDYIAEHAPPEFRESFLNTPDVHKVITE